MLEVKGKNGSAKIFTDNIDKTTMRQIYGILSSPVSANSHIRIMPDCHAGAGCVIGTTMKITDKVCPNIVGVDIGCGVLTSDLGKIDLDLEKLDNFIKRAIPHGFSVHNSERPGSHFVIKQLHCKEHLKKMDRLLASMGTLGGGNHFIEVDKDDEGNNYLVVHTGSRNLGYQVAQYYQKLATKRVEDRFKKIKDNEVKALIKELKSQGRQKEIKVEIKKLDLKRDWSKELDYLEGKDLQEYLEDMELCQWFASINRSAISNRILEFLGLPVENISKFDTVHNYIDVEEKILRKGAVSAQKDKKLIIPINMRDGALICKGLGSEDWNYSAPHGAGRLLSRSQAKKTFVEEEFKETMKGIYTTTANQNTIDESPMAYKPIEDIINNIGETVEIIKRIRPIYNFKAN